MILLFADTESSSDRLRGKNNHNPATHPDATGAWSELVCIDYEVQRSPLSSGVRTRAFSIDDVLQLLPPVRQFLHQQLHSKQEEES